MEKYNYLKAVTADAKEWLLDNYEPEDITEDDYEEYYDNMLISDSVTGNASGSYTFNTWQARENLCHNWDLMEEANNELVGLENVIITDDWKYGAEYWDVIIRCYLLNEAINNAIEEIKEERDAK